MFFAFYANDENIWESAFSWFNNVRKTYQVSLRASAHTGVAIRFSTEQPFHPVDKKQETQSGVIARVRSTRGNLKGRRCILHAPKE